MRRGIGIVAVVVVILAGIGIGVGAYNAGERNGIAQGIEQVQVAQDNGQEVQVVHVVGDEHRGFFPGFFLFPLFLIGVVLPDRRDHAGSGSLGSKRARRLRAGTLERGGPAPVRGTSSRVASA